MIEKLLRASSFFVFFGRGHEHVFFDAPYRSLFWNQDLLEKVITGVFQMSWKDYATSPRIDFYIQSFIVSIGVFYFVCSLLSLFVKRQSVWPTRILYLGGFSLFILSSLNFNEHFFQFGQLLEMVLQWGAVFFLIFYLKNVENLEKVMSVFKIGVGLTFIGHALYAIGYYPVPGKFIDMIIIITGLNESQCLNLLKVMGTLDILVFVFSFLNFFEVYIFSFATIWGLLTSLARVTSTLILTFSLSGLHQSLYETIYRLPHFIIPLVIVIYFKNRKMKKIYPVNV